MFTFFILLLASGIVTAAQITVNPGDSIQNAINSASPGDVIVVKSGTYIENVTIPKEKDSLTIKSDTGNPENTKVVTRNPHANVFYVKANNIKISGFNISGATASGFGGIYLYYTRDCTIENNKLYNNAAGVFLWYAESNKILSNTATNNGDYGGILLQASKLNTISGNKVSGNKRGVYFATSPNNTLSSNTVQYSTGDWGLFVCGHSPDSRIYNNYFNETNMTIRRTLVGGPDILNVPKTTGPNIVGGPYIGGNFWGRPDKTGFSQTAVDKNGDGFADSAYINATGGPFTDNLPLVNPVPLVANFTSNVTAGKAPLKVGFTDSSTGSPTAWNWNFGDKTANSTLKNPTHTYTAAGNYSVSLTVTNGAGNKTVTKLNYIKVTAGTPIPVANFSSNITSGKVPLTVAFTDKSTNSPTSWNWNFGDGTANSTVKNPTHIYSKAGTFTVKLTATNTAGSNTVTKSNYITVVTTPVANFSGTPTTGKATLKVQFTDKSTNSPSSWAWNFGDGTANSTAKNPAHNYTKKGTFTVTLTAKNIAGSSTKALAKYITTT
jgi:parallel beta-helix repeat protein